MPSTDSLYVPVHGRAGSDLALALGGVTLPWPVLGAGVGEAVTGTVGTLVSSSLAPELTPGGTLVLTEETSLPVAGLREIELRPASDGLVVSGHLVPVPAVPRSPGWRRPAQRVVLASRPLLRCEIGEWLEAPTVPDGTQTDGATPSVLVLVPMGPTPDRIPGDVLRRTLLHVAVRPGVAVEAVPFAWRDAASDSALVKALGDALGRPVEVLDAEQPEWLSALDHLAKGVAPGVLDEETAAVLLAWRPPPAQRGLVVFFTGLSGSGKSSLAEALGDHLRTSTSRTVTMLDGDVVRLMLSSGLGFDRMSRDLNIRRMGFVAAEIARHRGMTVCAPIAPFAQTRADVRAMVEEVGDFVLIHVSTPLEVCEERDRKGLYARARAGLLPDFTGISSPYEVPTDADLVVDTTERSLTESLAEVVGYLESKGWITA